MSSILVIDDEPGIRSVLRDVLNDEGYDTCAAEDGYEGLAVLESQSIDIVLLDVWLPGIGGIDVLKRIKKTYSDTKVIVISGHGTINLAVQAIKLGAFDFLEKPLSLEKTTTVVRNALKIEDLKRENRSLKNSLLIEDEFIGESASIQKIRELIEQSAKSDARILITGENGTGKELVARSIHLTSPRASGPFIEVNCAAIPESLIESELFGHEKGAFTSAVALRRGKFELANRGTLFLDEIADMSLSTQAKILRVIQELTFDRVGGEKPISVDVRLIAATNKDMHDQIHAGKFREDLFFRLNVIPIYVPPLRERIDDLDPLLTYFIKKYQRPEEPGPKNFVPEAIGLLQKYPWPGNIRELKNFAERVNIMADEHTISPATVRSYLGSAVVTEDSVYGRFDGLSLSEARDRFEQELIARKLGDNDGSITRTSRDLGMTPSGLHNKIKKLGIEQRK